MAEGEEILKFVEALLILNKFNPSEAGNIQEILAENIDKLSCFMKLDFNNIYELLNDLRKIDYQSDLPIWKYLILNTYCITQLISELENQPDFLVSRMSLIKDLKAFFKNFITVGVECNLLKNMPAYKQMISASFFEEEDFVTASYNRMVFTTHSFLLFLRSKQFILILTPFLHTIINALYQIIYCPLMKVGFQSKDFTMTEEKMSVLKDDKLFFQDHLETLDKTLGKEILMKSTILLYKNLSDKHKSKPWLVKALNLNFTKMMRSKNGLDSMARALFNTDYDINDKAINWRSIDLIVNFIFSQKSAGDFKSNIVNQVVGFLQAQRYKEEKYFEDIFIACTKKAFEESDESVKMVFEDALFGGFKITGDVTRLFPRSIRLIHQAFIRKHPNYENLPACALKPVAVIIFQLYMETRSSTFKDFNVQLKEILAYFLKDFRIQFYDRVFDFEENDLCLSNVQVVVKEGVIFVKEIKDRPDFAQEVISLVEGSQVEAVELCIYMIKILCEENSRTDKSLEDFSLSLNKRKHAYFVLLKLISNNSKMQKAILRNTTDIISYILTIIDKCIEDQMYLRGNQDDSSLFVILALLRELAKNCEDVVKFQVFLERLEVIKAKSDNEELKGEVIALIGIIKSRKSGESYDEVVAKEYQGLSEVERAILEVQDPLLAVRGHGLMVLAKLVEGKDPEAIKKSTILLNIFQQNLNDEDSYIYLNAINGLCALGDSFPAVVIPALTEEYVDFHRDDSDENIKLRLKIGEILVRITRRLGTTAVKYKTDLVNTFLATCKDDDHLIRTSSLSNLGEVCQVIGSDLGPILDEIVKLVFDILKTDAAAEPRRAAIGVFRQMFIGLGSDACKILKNNGELIIQVLKEIYLNNEDDCMKLQAQLALEQLMENNFGKHSFLDM